jgi:hypothetical protein
VIKPTFYLPEIQLSHINTQDCFINDISEVQVGVLQLFKRERWVQMRDMKGKSRVAVELWFGDKGLEGPA